MALARFGQKTKSRNGLPTKPALAMRPWVVLQLMMMRWTVHWMIGAANAELEMEMCRLLPARQNAQAPSMLVASQRQCTCSPFFNIPVPIHLCSEQHNPFVSTDSSFNTRRDPFLLSRLSLSPRLALIHHIGSQPSSPRLIGPFFSTYISP